MVGDWLLDDGDRDGDGLPTGRDGGGGGGGGGGSWLHLSPVPADLLTCDPLTDAAIPSDGDDSFCSREGGVESPAVVDGTELS